MAENRRKSGGGHGGAIAIMLTFILMIIFTTALLFLPERKPVKAKNPTPTETPAGETESQNKYKEQLAVVLEVDTELKMITVFDVMEEKEHRLVYTGAAAFYDGYGIQMSAAQLVVGGLYRFTVDTEEEWISTATEAVDRRENKSADGVWEKKHVDYMEITPEMITFRNQNFRYSEQVCVMSNGKRISVADIRPGVDVMTVRGLGQVIYEIVVTKGHGYIQLENQADFLGGTITIGSTKIDAITGEGLYMVREGTYLVNVSKGIYTGTKSIQVVRDQTSTFDVFAYGKGNVKKGWLTVSVDPAWADLFVDGVKTAYGDGLELEYGSYELELTAGGYQSYSATVIIEQPKQSLSVYLTEQKESETPTDPETEDTEDTEDKEGGSSAVQTSVTVANMGYTLDLESAIYIWGPIGAEILLDGESLGEAPMNFEKIVGSFLITVIKEDGSRKNFNCTGKDDGKDINYTFSWE